MSGGMEDGSAVGRIAEGLERAAHQLRQAIRTAEEGHRGLTIDIPETVNEILMGSGFELRRAPGRKT